MRKKFVNSARKFKTNLVNWQMGFICYFDVLRPDNKAAPPQKLLANLLWVNGIVFRKASRYGSAFLEVVHAIPGGTRLGASFESITDRAHLEFGLAPAQLPACTHILVWENSRLPKNFRSKEQISR